MAIFTFEMFFKILQGIRHLEEIDFTRSRLKPETPVSRNLSRHCHVPWEVNAGRVYLLKLCSPGISGPTLFHPVPDLGLSLRDGGF